MSQRKVNTSSDPKWSRGLVLCSLSVVLAPACGSDLETPVYKGATTGAFTAGPTTSGIGGSSTAAASTTGGSSVGGGSSSSALTGSGTSSSTGSNGTGGASNTSSSTTGSATSTGNNGNNGNTNGGFPDCGGEGEECCGPGFCLGNDLECVDDICVQEGEGGEGGAAGADSS